MTILQICEPPNCKYAWVDCRFEVALLPITNRWQTCLCCADIGFYSAFHYNVSRLYIFMWIWNNMQEKHNIAVIRF